MLTVGVLAAPAAAQAATTITLAWGCFGSVAGPCAVPGGLTDPTALAAGGDHGLAVKADGTVVAWGCGFNYGQCNVPGGLAAVTAVAGSLTHSLALKSDGTVVAWGCGSLDRGQCTVPVGLAGVTAVAAGTYHSLALKSDGTVVAWGCGGSQNYGQCDVPIDLAGVTAVAASTAHSLALKSDGTVVAWGCGPFDAGQCMVPGSLTGVTAIAAGRTQSLALKGDGTVVAWGCGDLNFGQCNVPGGLAGVTAISAAYGHSLALKSDGTVVAWGCGAGHDFGQCKVPAALAGVTAIAAGDFHSLVVAALIDQTITFAPLPDRTSGESFTPSATASSGLPVSFSASGACFFYAGVVYITSGGSCTVTASQPGGLNFNPAPDVSRTFTIARVRQSITFFSARDEDVRRPGLRRLGLCQLRPAGGLRCERELCGQRCDRTSDGRRFLHDHRLPSGRRELGARTGCFADVRDPEGCPAAGAACDARPVQGASSRRQAPRRRQADDRQAALPHRQGRLRLLTQAQEGDRHLPKPPTWTSAARALEGRPDR